MLELMIHLDSDSKKPLYEQIYDHIRLQIADGKISCGEKLPSTRFLAGYLQISRSTAEAAYAQLISEGYMESRPNRGYYAGDISDLYLERRHWGGSIKADGETVPKERPSVEKENCRIDFSPDENDLSYFPYRAWRKISKDVLACDDRSLFCAGEAAGEWELREAICRYLYHARGVNCSPGQMVIGAGNEYLLILLAQVFGKKQTVAVENPTYQKACRTLANMGCEILFADRDESGVRMEELCALKPDLVYTMPSHQFPMGTVMPMKRRLELLQWAAEQPGRFIIEDDHDSEFRYKGKPIPSLQGNDGGGTVIYIGTFSKSISPSIRVSYMVLPEVLLKAYHTNCGFYASTVPKEQQRMLAAFIRQGHFERYLNKMRRIYKAKHDLLLSLLKKEHWVRKIYGDYAGMHLLVELNTKKSASSIVKEARENGVRVYSLEEFTVPGAKRAEAFHPTLLLGYGALQEEELREGISCLRNILR